MFETSPHRITRDRLHFLAVIHLLLLISLVSACQRVYRKHSPQIATEYAHLTVRVTASHPANPVLYHNEVLHDLDQLEWLIENRYSYRNLKGIDYRAALDSIRASLGPTITRFALAYQLQKMIALFGDGHNLIDDPNLKKINTQFLPFLVMESKGRLYAIKIDRTDFVNPQYPCLKSLDGYPINEWLRAASRLSAQGTPQFTREHAIRSLRYVDCLRVELNLPQQEGVTVELESPDSKNIIKLQMPTPPSCPLYEGTRGKAKIEFNRIKDRYGYLRIPTMSPEKQYLMDITAAMEQLRNTHGLIIDIRGNGGGTRAVLKLLFPYFMSPQDKPRVVNVVKFRSGTPWIKSRAEGRNLYPRSASNWSEAEKDAIDNLMLTFKPQWEPPQTEFGEWRYFVISPSMNSTSTYHYGKPVVILMDRYCFSASDIFLGAFKGWHNVTLMGTPSGGGSGGRVPYLLKESGIKLYLSGMSSYRSNGQLYDGNGIDPDLFIEPEPSDFIGRTDTMLDAAIDFLQTKNPLPSH